MAITRIGWPLGFKTGPGETDVSNHSGIATIRDSSGVVTDVVDGTGSVAAEIVANAYSPDIKADGITDDAPAIQAAINLYSETSRISFVFPPNKTIKCNSGLTFRAGAVSFDLNGSILDFSGMSSGFAITIQPPLDPYSTYAHLRDVLSNGRIVGSGVDGATVDGIKFDRLTAGVGVLTGMSFRNITVHGFRDNFFSDRGTYINHFFNVSSTAATRYGINYPGSEYAGESWSWFGGRVADAHNGTNTAVGIYMGSGGANQLHFYGTCVDYNDIQAVIASGRFRCYGGNHENNKTAAAYQISQSGGDWSELVLACDVSLTEVAPGRTSLITTSGDQCFIDLSSAHIYAYQMTTEFVTVSSGSPKVNWEGLHVIATGGDGQQPAICKNYSLVYQGQDASSPVTVPWVASSGNVGITVGTGAGYLSGNSIRLTWTGVASADAYYEVPCLPGQILLFEGRINVTTAPASTNIYLRVRFVDRLGNLISNTDFRQWAAVTGGYQKFSNWRRVPSGATGCRIDFWNGATAPVAEIDNLYAWVM